MKLQNLLCFHILSFLLITCWGQTCTDRIGMIPTSTLSASDEFASEELCCEFAHRNNDGSYHVYQLPGTEGNPRYWCDTYIGRTFSSSPQNRSGEVDAATSPPTTTTGTGSTGSFTTIVTTPSATTGSTQFTTTTSTPLQCPSPISDQIEFHPHPDDCRKYYLCLNGAYLREQQCGSGILFDYIDKICKPAPEAICAPGATPPTSAPELTTTPQPARCPPTGEVKLSHLWDCRKFYYCVNGIGYESLCPDGSLFDFVERLCLPLELARCLPGATTPLPVTCVPDGTTYYQPHPNDCRRYIMCINGQIDDRLCPNSFLFDYVERLCMPAPVARCAPGATTPPPIQPTTPIPIFCPPEGRFKQPHPYDCIKYYFCIDGISILETCYPGSLFDRIILNCVPQENALCYPTATTPTIATTTPTTTEMLTTPIPETTSMMITPSTPPETTSVTVTTPTTTEMTSTSLRPSRPGQIIDCPQEGLWLIPHPYDCTQYFECFNGFPTQKKCQYYNEIFDYISGECEVLSEDGWAECFPGATMPPPFWGIGTRPSVGVHIIAIAIILVQIWAN